MSVVSGRLVRRRQMGSATTAPSAQPSSSMFTTSNRMNFRAPIMKANTMRPASGMPDAEAKDASRARRVGAGDSAASCTDDAAPAALAPPPRSPGRAPPRGRFHAARQGTGKLASTSTTNTMSPTPKVVEDSRSPTSAAQPTERAHHKSAWRRS